MSVRLFARLRVTGIIRMVESAQIAKRVVLGTMLTLSVLCTYAASRFNRGMNQFGVGARGGVSSISAPDAGISGGMGFAARLDMEYTRYFNRSMYNRPFLGIKTGLSLGYSTASLSGSIKDQYSTLDSEGDRLDYTVTAENVKAQLSQVQLQIPVMFSFLFNGLFFNAGVRMAFPLAGTYNQTADDIHITAYYAKYGVTLVDEPFTGCVNDYTVKSNGSWNTPKFQLFAGGDVGYEIKIKHGPGIGVGAYFDYCVYNVFSRNTVNSMVYVHGIGENPQAPAATVDVVSVTNSASSLGFWEAGLKITVNFR